MAPSPPGLSPTLRALVRVVEGTLGQVIAEAEGDALFELVEGIRRRMVVAREGSPRATTRALEGARAELLARPLRERALVARAYTIYLELINACESAYRTHRLRRRRRTEAQDAAAACADAVFVLTAHPTESRSPTNIRLLRRLQDLLVEALERSGQPDPGELKHLLHLVWRTGSHPPHKPSVEDEARHLVSLVSDPILDELLRLRAEGHRVLLRTWVGGDKDGHPFVGPEETDASLNLSRTRLLAFVQARIVAPLGEDLSLLPDPRLEEAAAALRRALDALRVVTIGDGRRLSLLREALDELSARYQRRRGHPHPLLARLETLLGIFPGLVIPLELREERGQLTPGSTIAQMLHYLGDVARGGRVDAYVRGLVVSMTDCPADLLEAEALVEGVLGAPALPVIPLFEMPDVLPRAVSILEGTLEDAGFRAALARWGYLEVMLGYSDTSKRMGVLPSRLAIQRAMKEISAWARARELRVVFFHGSGGSVGRGGGRVEDQAASWPPAALAVVKQTLQGEMVERTLATPEILRSQVEKIAAVQADPPRYRQASPAARELAELAERTYVELVGSPEFQRLLRQATPYARLGSLNIGSRPVSRGKAQESGSLESLRAIPWVLCWTQTRYLLHAWLGIGTAWRTVRADPERRARLLRSLRRDPPLRSFIRLLGFTLAKTAPRVWREYAQVLAGEESARLVKRLEREWRDALDLAREASGAGELLSERPWLRESIYYRAPMIHPLNLLQIDALGQARLNKAQQLLFRETVTGIAAGMLTTG